MSLYTINKIFETYNVADFTIDDIKKLNGKDVDKLSAEEGSIFNFFVLQGGRFGVTLDTSPVIPENELDRARFMKLSLAERNNSYPSIIEVEITEPN